MASTPPRTHTRAATPNSGTLSATTLGFLNTPGRTRVPTTTATAMRVPRPRTNPDFEEVVAVFMKDSVRGGDPRVQPGPANLAHREGDGRQPPGARPGRGRERN